MPSSDLRYWLGGAWRCLIKESYGLALGCMARQKSFVREVLRVPLQEIERHKSGTTVIHLNKRDLEMSTVCVPTTSAVQAFEMAADPLREKIVATAKESAILIELRDTLLPRLLSGEIQAYGMSSELLRVRRERAYRDERGGVGSARLWTTLGELAWQAG